MPPCALLAPSPRARSDGFPTKLLTLKIPWHKDGAGDRRDTKLLRGNLHYTHCTAFINLLLTLPPGGTSDSLGPAPSKPQPRCKRHCPQTPGCPGTTSCPGHAARGVQRKRAPRFLGGGGETLCTPREKTLQPFLYTSMCLFIYCCFLVVVLIVCF